MANDPFSNSHRETARAAEKQKVAQEIVERDNRITEREKARKAPPKQDRPYIPTKPPWASYG